jgi:hypothetical protein
MLGIWGYCLVDIEPLVDCDDRVDDSPGKRIVLETHPLISLISTSPFPTSTFRFHTTTKRCGCDSVNEYLPNVFLIRCVREGDKGIGGMWGYCLVHIDPAEVCRLAGKVDQQPGLATRRFEIRSQLSVVCFTEVFYGLQF